MNLAEAIKQRQQNTENKFLTGLLQFGLRSEPQFDISGDTPVYIGGGSKMPDKTVLWNQYIQLKKGRLTPQDLAHVDVKKGSDMFRKVNAPIIGVVENMSGLMLNCNVIYITLLYMQW